MTEWQRVSEEAARPSFSYSSGKTRLTFLSSFDELSVYLLHSMTLSVCGNRKAW